MPLHLLDIDVARTGPQYGPDAWIPAARTLAIASVPETILERELWRYLREEVEGRSFLIAGHRGAGKTTLVHRAVASVADEVLIAAAAGQPLPARQRPLLVRLHGPSLFSGRLPEQGSVPKTDGSAAAESAKAETTTAKPAQPSTHDRTRAALAQIMAALYRALATEVARRFRTQALRGGQPASPAATARLAEGLELAARLRLELDTAPGPGALRAVYRRAGRLRQGVLWPEVGAARLDQGVREIVAVATAAQSFQVCIGAVSYQHVSKGTGEQSVKAEAKGEANLKGVLDRLSGLLVGAAVGTGVGAVSGSAANAATAGLVGGLVSALTFSFAATRADRRDESAEYRFIRDFSLATLDRDLPEVIQRLREAGLAPVFVIDELDKLDDTRACVEELIGQLKNLTTDYGFFCFLTNRAYYEDVWWRMRQSAYPREFTYFSNLLFVHYGAPEVLRYLLRIVQPAETARPTQEAAAWMTFAFAARHRSRLNSIALMRELSLAFDEAGAMRVSPERIAASVQGRLQASVQVAVDLCLDGPELSVRIAADPLFAQLAVDALYRLSAAWESGEEDVSLGPVALAAYLRTRSDAPAPAEADPPSEPPDPPPARAAPRGVATTDALSPEDLALLSRSAIGLADLLADFDALKKAAAGYWTPHRRELLAGIGPDDTFVAAGLAAFEGIVGAGLMPEGITGLVEKVANGRYAFQVDRYGARHARRSQEAVTADAAALLETADALLDSFADLGVTPAALIDAGVLAASAAEQPLAEASTRIRAGRAEAEDGSLVRAFVETCVAAGDILGWTILLARTVVGTSGKTEDGLRAVLRHLRIDEVDRAAAGASLDTLLDGILNDVPPGVTVPPPFAADPGSVRDWRERIRGAGRALVAPPRDGNDIERWEAWRPRVLSFLAEPEPSPGAVSLEDVVQAVHGTWPGGLLRRRLGTVTVAEWSALAQRASPFPVEGGPDDENLDSSVPQPPRWAFVAALAALGFDRDIVAAAAEQVGGAKGLDDFVRAARDAGPKRAGVLWFKDDTADLADAPPPPDATGILAVNEFELWRSARLIGWLAERNAFDLVGRDGGTPRVRLERGDE
ncbi:hypothetical protein [Methylobacterium nonmethylotrophicum]|uniref:hypothetical protein n=1 Tax=Methylobacterium nonmethylotrophicum TaxID=1141884 RepID=UPI001436AA5F|nr:hypothetical protein [Methylobacterium nonmethylotrophicum]